MDFTQEHLRPGVRRIQLIGTLDAPGAMSIEETFISALTAEGGQVIIDLTQTEYMSSYGLRMLLVGARELQDSGGNLHLAGASEAVMGVLQMAGYDTMFPVYDTVDSALASI
ncbi:MAG: STAS domain-containing protein [Chloroflexi bacterium]|nr:STAS domain-containing protein [Chloroflexota bacterium]